VPSLDTVISWATARRSRLEGPTGVADVPVGGRRAVTRRGDEPTSRPAILSSAASTSVETFRPFSPAPSAGAVDFPGRRRAGSDSDRRGRRARPLRSLPLPARHSVRGYHFLGLPWS